MRRERSERWESFDALLPYVEASVEVALGEGEGERPVLPPRADTTASPTPTPSPAPAPRDTTETLPVDNTISDMPASAARTSWLWWAAIAGFAAASTAYWWWGL